MIPQIQLAYANVGFSGFTDIFGTHVKARQGDSLQGRPGVMLEHNTSYRNQKGISTVQKLYGLANLYYEFFDGPQVNVADTNFASKNDRLWGGLGLGGQYSWNNEQYAFFGEGIVDTSLDNFGDSHSIKGSIGLKIRW